MQDVREAGAEIAPTTMRAAIACSYLAIGVILMVVFRRSTWSISIVRQEPEWYQSDYLPLFVACFVFCVVSFWVRLRILESAVFGLLITGPPYGWLSWLLMQLANTSGEDGTANAKAVLPLAVGLALSGAVLNPLLSGIVGRIRQRSRLKEGRAQKTAR